MKYILFSLAVVFLIGCSPKDEAYYTAHIDDAKNKIASCEDKAEEAFKEADKEALEKIMGDEECRAATSANRYFEQEQTKLKRKLAEEKRQSESQVLREEILNKYQGLSWQEFFVAYNAPDFRGGRHALDEGYRIQNEILKTKQVEAKKDIGSNEYDVLLKQKNKYCEKDRRRVSACVVYEEVMNLKKSNIIENLAANYDELKKVFNECHKLVTSLGKARKFSESNNVARSYPCDLALKAASKRRIAHNYNSPLG